MSEVDPAFALCAVAAMLIAGLSKGGFGSAGAFACVPILALAAPPGDAVAILLPVLCVMDLVGLRVFRGRWNWREAKPLMIATIPGVAIGWATFGLLSPDALRVVIGTISLLFAAHQLLPRRDAPEAAPFSAIRAGAWGAVGGFTSFVAHAGGPPLSIYLLTRRLEKAAFQATTVLLFWWINFTKVPAYAALGLFSVENLKTSAILAPLAPAGMLLGVWAHERVSDRVYFRIIVGLLAVAGAKLIWDGLRP